ncbi:hypothetical protein PENSPDRAFT_755623 [Peniophora sp. CONT]|nr:hypothetical protein PENSPDRAFT_755623 [Peniophora sp. CONT]
MSTFPMVNVAGAQLDVAPLGIHDIPAELFDLILSCLREVDPPLPGHNYRRPLGWLNATFVSHSWRASALSNRSLWTCIPIDIGKSWPRVFLERSHPLPVVFNRGFQLLKSHMDIYWDELLSREFRRIRTLEINFNGNDDDREDTVYAVIEQSSETLETLVLRRCWTKLEFPRLRSHQYPHLRKLHLMFGLTMHAEDFPWREIGPSGLRDLRVEVKQPRNIDRHVADVVCALMRLPSLETFVLIEQDKRSRRTDNDTNSEVDHSSSHGLYLSNLENLNLFTDGDIIVRILGLVSFSTSVTTTLRTVPHVAIKRATLYAYLLPWIAAQSKAGPPRRLAFTSDGRHYNPVQVNLFRSLETGRAAYLCVTVDPTIHDAFADVLYNLEPDGIRVLDIAPLLLLSRNDNNLLYHVSFICRNITCITISPSLVSEDVTGSLARILRRMLLPVEGAAACLPFPNLMMLDLTVLSKKILSKEMFAARGTDEQGTIQPPTIADTLLNTMKARRDAGGVLPRTYLSEWTRPMSPCEERVLDVARTIPGVVFLPEGSRVPFDGVLD